MMTLKEYNETARHIQTLLKKKTPTLNWTVWELNKPDYQAMQSFHISVRFTINDRPLGSNTEVSVEEWRITERHDNLIWHIVRNMIGQCLDYLIVE